MPGTRITSPGPFTFQKRPSWNTTARWYSRKTRSDDTARMTSRKIRTNGPNSAIGGSSMIRCVDVGAMARAGLSPFGGRDARHDAVHADDANLLAACKPRLGRHPPRLAPNGRPADARRVVDHLAVGAYQRPDAAHDGRATRAHGHAHDDQHERERHEREDHDQRARNAEGRHVGIDRKSTRLNSSHPSI